MVPKTQETREVSEDDVLEATLDAGAEEVNDLDEAFQVQSEATDVVEVRTALQAAGIDYDSADVEFVASMEIPVADSDSAGKVFRLVDALEDLDDVQNVFTNVDVPDDGARRARGRRRIRRASGVSRPAEGRWRRSVADEQRSDGRVTMRVLGIDPGLTRCGVGVVEGSLGRPLSLVDVNVLRTSAGVPVAERLVTIEKGLDAWLDEFQPDAVAVERIFARSDSSTIMGTAQASGIALVVAARRGLPVAMHTPSEVKAAVSGSGRADKAQVGAMVTRILRLDAPPQAGRRRRRARAGHHPHLARQRPGTHRRRARRGREEAVIAFVRGEVAAVTLTSAVLEVGGVGLELMCTPGTLATLRVGRQATLPTSMVVREDSLTVFGFLDEDEKQAFELVQTASGVGPQARPGDARGALARRPAGRGGRRGRQDPHPGARHRPEGRPAHHPRAPRPHRQPRSAPGARVRRPRRPPRRGATRSSRASSASAGRPRRPTRRSRPSPTRPAPSPDVPALLRAALRTLSKA